MPLLRKKTANKAFYLCLALVGIVIFSVFLVVPLVFRWFPSLIRSFIFEPHDEIPINVDYKHPENFGFPGGRNFNLTTVDGATLGVWHLLPFTLEDEARNLNLTEMEKASATQVYNDWLSDATVVLYLHGSAGTRTSSHRLRVYRLLSHLNYHVITFDYRGYGDSTSLPKSESDLIEDTRTVFAWIRDRVARGNILMWGHSLGTGVASHASDYLENRGEQIRGIVLEAPFNNMAAAVRVNSLANAVSFLPWFDYCFIQPLQKNDLRFESDKHLKNISTPVLILHAKDDKIIPYKLADELYKDVLGSRKNATSVQLIGYDSKLGYGHYNIVLDPNLNTTVRQFVERTIH